MSRRHGRPNALDVSRELRGLTVRDRLSRVLDYRALAAGSDARAVVAAKQTELAVAGWRVDALPKNCGFFFADRDTDRVCVAVECFEPVSNSSLKRGQ